MSNYKMFYIPLIIGLIVNFITGNLVRKRAEERLAHPYTPLPDLLHDSFPKIPVLIPDFFLLICIILVIYNYPYLLDFEKNILTIGHCSIIRSFSVGFTTMPTCMPKPSADASVYTKVFLNTHDLLLSFNI